MRSFFTTVLFLCLLESAGARTYYFSASGDDSRSATQAQSQSTPWKSIAKLNGVFSLLQPGDVVLFKRGDTFYGTIKPTKSGTPSAPITFGAYGSGDKPNITGFVTLSNWASIGGGKYTSYNSSLGSNIHSLTLNGAPKALGRYPNSGAANKGYLTFESHGSSSIKDYELSSSPNWTGAELVLRSHHWVLDRLKITGHSGTTLTFSPAASYTPKDGYGYFIQNDIRTLDQLGEWAYKASTKKVTLYFGSNAPSNYKVKASVLKNLVYIYNQDNLVFDNLAFTGANEDGFYVYSSDNTKITNCDVRFSGINGIHGSITNALRVENCTITHTNNIAVFLRYKTNASIIRNNEITHTAVLAGMGQNGDNEGIGVRANGDNNLVEYNQIKNTGYCGIRFTGNGTVIKNNLIDNFAFVKDDAAGIYTSASAGSEEQYGRKIIGNIIVNGVGAREGTSTQVVQQVSGIYLDDHTSGVEVRGNTVANCGKVGLYVHNSYKIKIYNNTFYNNTGQALLNHDRSIAPTLRYITMKNNIMFSKTAEQVVAMFYTRLNDIASFGTIDSNFYMRPVDDNVTIQGITGLYTSTQVRSWYTLDKWKPKYNHDDDTKKAPKTLSSTANPDDYIRFVYNASKASKAVALNGTYVDARNKSYASSITLAPYASAVLIKTATTTSTAPTVSLTSPKTNATFSAPASITLTAAAADNDGTIKKVEFYNGTELLGSDETSPYSFSWTNVKAGTYTLTAKAMDNDSLETTSEAIVTSVYMPNKAPVVNITSPVINATFAAPSSITITATATDADGVINKVEFYNGETLLGTDTESPYALTWSNVAEGTYSIKAKAVDDSAEISYSAPVAISVYTETKQDTLKVVPQNVAPVVSITSPKANATYSAPASVRLTATATDADGTISKVEFYNGTTLLHTENIAPYDWTWTNVKAGTYKFIAKAFDNSGAATTSTAVSFTVNTITNSAPVVKITSPVLNATYNAPASVILSATATDADGTISKVQFYNGTTLLKTEYTAPYYWTWTNVNVGNYTITAKATDNNGNVTISTPVAFTVSTITNSAPVVTITSPLLNASYTAPASVRLTAKATDADGTIKKVEYYIGSTLIHTESDAPYDWTWTNVKAGSYIFTAKATDNSGKTTTSAAVSFTVAASSLTSATDNSLQQSNLISVNKENAFKYLDFTLFPNPATNKIQLQFAKVQKNQKANLTISDLAGNVFKSIPVTISGKVLEVDISLLNTGNYIINLTTGNQFVSKNFLKIR